MPLELIATPFIDGTVRLKWNRNGNPANTSFQIEQQTPSGWVYVKTVSGTKTKLNGYTPGVSASFRVIATRLGLTSPASNVTSIYPSDGEQVELVAA